MIQTKEELKMYLQADYERFGKSPKLKDWILKNEWAYIYKYQRILRHIEYYGNKKGVYRLFFYGISFCIRELDFCCILRYILIL